MDTGESRKHNIGHNRPHAGREPSFTTSTTYHTNTSNSFTRGSSIGVSIGSSSPPQGLFGFPHHGTGSSITHGSTSGTSTTYGSGLGFGVRCREGLSTDFVDTVPPHPAHSDLFDEIRRDAERSERKFKIFAASLVALCFGVIIWAMLAGSGVETGNDSGSGGRSGKTNSSSSWTFWIPLGPLWIGYGSEGFQWSVQFLF